MLIAAAVLLILIGLVHSYLGERYILIRLFRAELPRLFGDDIFTKQVLRFAWHLTTVAWFGFAAMLIALAMEVVNFSTIALCIISAVFLLSGAMSFVGSKGKHVSYVVFWAVALICVYVAMNR